MTQHHHNDILSAARDVPVYVDLNVYSGKKIETNESKVIIIFSEDFVDKAISCSATDIRQGFSCFEIEEIPMGEEALLSAIFGFKFKGERKNIDNVVFSTNHIANIKESYRFKTTSISNYTVYFVKNKNIVLHMCDPEPHDIYVYSVSHCQKFSSSFLKLHASWQEQEARNIKNPVFGLNGVHTFLNIEFGLVKKTAVLPDKEYYLRKINYASKHVGGYTLSDNGNNDVIYKILLNNNYFELDTRKLINSIFSTQKFDYERSMCFPGAGRESMTIAFCNDGVEYNERIWTGCGHISSLTNNLPSNVFEDLKDGEKNKEVFALSGDYARQFLYLGEVFLKENKYIKNIISKQEEDEREMRIEERFRIGIRDRKSVKELLLLGEKDDKSKELKTRSYITRFFASIKHTVEEMVSYLSPKNDKILTSNDKEACLDYEIKAGGAARFKTSVLKRKIIEASKVVIDDYVKPSNVMGLRGELIYITPFVQGLEPLIYRSFFVREEKIDRASIPLDNGDFVMIDLGKILSIRKELYLFMNDYDYKRNIDRVYSDEYEHFKKNNKTDVYLQKLVKSFGCKSIHSLKLSGIEEKKLFYSMFMGIYDRSVVKSIEGYGIILLYSFTLFRDMMLEEIIGKKWGGSWSNEVDGLLLNYVLGKASISAAKECDIALHFLDLDGLDGFSLNKFIERSLFVKYEISPVFLLNNIRNKIECLKNCYEERGIYNAYSGFVSSS